MCDDCGKRKHSYDWVRDGNGKPKLTPNGSYVMEESMGAYYGFDLESIDQVRELLNEIERIEL